MQGVAPICVACSRYRPFDDDHREAWCAAFPEGIPDAISFEGFDHREPFEGDHGIRFALRLGDDEKLSAWVAGASQA